MIVSILNGVRLQSKGMWRENPPLFFSSLCLPLVCQLFHKPVLFSEMEFEFLLLVFILGDWPSRPPWLLLLWKINTFINQLNHHEKILILPIEISILFSRIVILGHWFVVIVIILFIVIDIMCNSVTIIGIVVCK